MNLKDFKFDVDSDGIALVTWDMGDKPMNVIDENVMKELDQIIDKVVSDPAIKGAVLTSGKEAFCAGADLKMLEKGAVEYEKVLKSDGEEAANKLAVENAGLASRLFRKLETCGKPWAAAINGLALGGGFEATLACHYRVISDSPKAAVGLPEVMVGLFPGAGGTQRVPRLMGTQDALGMLMRGAQIKPAKAKTMNLVHEVAPADEVVSRAKEWIKKGGKAVAPWDEKNFKLPSGKVYTAANTMVWPPANAIYRRETYDNYPGIKALLCSVFEGLQLPIDTGLKVESRYFSHIARSRQAAAMIRSLFLSKTELDKGARRPADVPKTTLKKIGVIGAGFMGAGIAYVTAQAGANVVLIDRDQAAADKGKDHTAAIMDKKISKKRATAEQKQELLSRITATADYGALAGCDLVVEAVFEDRAVKSETIKKAEAVIGPDVIFASNTSTLPISSLAVDALKPENFIGIHFFSPVDKMMLVEIIMGEKTGPRALAFALDFVRLIKKTPIVVNDARGFYINRCVGNYMREGHLMVMEGVPAAMVDNAARMAGMPVGPLTLSDEVALDLVWKVLQATKKDLGDKVIDPLQEGLIKAMVVDNERHGRKNSKGFYEYPQGGKKRIWPGLAKLVNKNIDADALCVQELKDRLLVVTALEASRTYFDNIVTDPREADVGSILGFGFAPYTGGTLSYIDGVGLANFVALADKLNAKFPGFNRFEVPQKLRDMAAKGETFYGNFNAKTQAA